MSTAVIDPFARAPSFEEWTRRGNRLDTVYLALQPHHAIARRRVAAILGVDVRNITRNPDNEGSECGLLNNAIRTHMEATYHAHAWRAILDAAVALQYAQEKGKAL